MLILGWGRIGKCLGRHLRSLGAEVCVFARNPRDRGLLAALGYKALDRAEMLAVLPGVKLVFNTAPEPLLSEADTQSCRALLVDLASRRGMEDPRALWARGLPGKLAPLSSGRLMAQTVCRLWKEGAA